MGPDLIRAKLPVVLILVTLATSAMFVARGATSLLAGALFPLEASVAVAAPRPGAAQVPGAEPPDAKAILARNAFDPSTGSLWPPRAAGPASPEATEEEAEAEVLAPGQMPPPCGAPFRLIASVHSEAFPQWSFANIAGGSGPPLLYRPGGHVGDREVAEIFPNAVFLRDAGGRLCSLALFSPQTQAGPGSYSTSSAPPAVSTAAPVASPGTPGFQEAISQDDLAKGIQQASETKYTVQRSLVDKVLANQAEIMRSARIVPHEQNGQVLGVKLYGIRRNSLLGMLGLQNGDLLRTINGYDMSSPDSALEAYSRLRTASQLTLSITRRGQATTMEYQIQ